MGQDAEQGIGRQRLLPLQQHQRQRHTQADDRDTQLWVDAQHGAQHHAQ